LSAVVAVIQTDLHIGSEVHRIPRRLETSISTNSVSPNDLELVMYFIENSTMLDKIISS
jgi:hypothetical protein